MRHVSVEDLLREMATDERTWNAVTESWRELIEYRAERARLQRMLTAQEVLETQALDRLTVALTVIKNRQAGT